jgi:hypothetical protein
MGNISSGVAINPENKKFHFAADVFTIFMTQKCERSNGSNTASPLFVKQD